jgi:hypothetical protein
LEDDVGSEGVGGADGDVPVARRVRDACLGEELRLARGIGDRGREGDEARLTG